MKLEQRMELNAERIYDLDSKINVLTGQKAEERETFVERESQQIAVIDELAKKFEKLYLQTRNFEEDVEAREFEKSSYRKQVQNEVSEKHNLNM
jgi:hypothetical protein